MRRVMLTALVLLLASPVQGQTLSSIAPYVSVAVGNYADWQTTRNDLETGRFHEAQPAVYRQDMRTVTIFKATGVAVVVTLMWALQKTGHPKASKVVGYLDAGVTSAAAVHNYRLLHP